MNKYLLDACAVLSFLLGEKEGYKVKEMLQDVSNSFYLNYSNYGEVIFTLGKKGFDSKKLLEVKRLIKNALEIKFISTDTFELTELASDYKISGGLSYFDALILAASKKYDLTILTKDRKFEKFSKTHKIKFL